LSDEPRQTECEFFHEGSIDFWFEFTTLLEVKRPKVTISRQNR
jgi:hypothetical protein